MQKQRDILELCFNELTQDRNTLRNLSSMAPRTFQRKMKKLENGERLGPKVGSGQPRMFSDSERQKIREFARSNPLSSSSKPSQIVAQETGKTAHRTTVAKYFFSSGYVQKLPKIVPELNEVQKQKRKTFSRDWAEYSFEDVFLTDESVFQLHRNTIKVWCLKDEKPKKPRPKFCQKVLVWGALNLRGFYLKIIEGGTVNAEKYCQIVDEFILYANRLYPEGWILEQEGATPHTARKTMKFFEEKNLQFLLWPPNSPDVNPIENVWEILKNTVEQKNPKTKQELIEAIQNSKSVITREIRENLMNSVGKRLKSCKRLPGELI